MKKLILLLNLLMPIMCWSQSKIIGFVNCNQKQTISNVHVTCGHYNGVTDSLGYFEIKAPKGFSQVFTFKHIGFKDKKVKMTSGYRYNVVLISKAQSVDEVKVLASKDLNLSTTDVVQVNASTIEKMPAQLGESDIIKIFEKNPGISRVNDMSSGINIRGGSGDQNQFIIDGQKIYNANHMLGLVSVFNSDIIKNASISKNGHSSRLGGKLSSYICVDNKIGDKVAYRGKIGVGNLFSRFALEGPIIKHKSSFALGIRKSYLDYMVSTYNRIHKGKEDFNPIPIYNFGDFQLRTNTKLKNNCFLDVNAVFTNDILSGTLTGSRKLDLDWSNKVASAKIKKYITCGSWDAQIGFTHYDVNSAIAHQDKFTSNSFVHSYTSKANLKMKLPERASITAGIFCNLNQYRYENNMYQNSTKTKHLNNESNTVYGGFYLQMQHYILDNLIFSFGSRANVYNNKDLYTDISPRLKMDYKTNKAVYTAAYSLTFQYEHLLSLYDINLPGDIWIPASDKMARQMGRHYSLGTTRNIGANTKVNITGFYKSTANIYEKKQDVDVSFKSPEEVLSKGTGSVTGIELSFSSKINSLNLSGSYTFNDTWAKNDAINNNNRYRPHWYKKHVANISAAYQVNEKVSLLASWSYASGSPFTFPVAVMMLQRLQHQNPVAVPIYGEKNNVYTPSQHKLNISMAKTYKKKNGKKAVLKIGLYNAYNHANPVFIYYKRKKDPIKGNSLEFKKMALLPIIPTINYTYEF